MRSCLLIACIIMLASCQKGRKPLLNESIGQPYEVLVVGDDSIATDIVRQQLLTPVEGLPQQEPSFDVSVTDQRHFNATLRSTRNIVVVRIGTSASGRTSIRKMSNTPASPQIEVVIDAPSVNQLQADMAGMGALLRQLLDDNETAAAQALLERSHNTEAEQTVREMFGIDMRIPADMTSSKRGTDFLWLSNNSPDAMQNICLYIYKKGINPTAIDWRTMRDSVMKENIPGEADGMYMRTAKTQLALNTTDSSTVCRGLWEMEGDMMGGPFVSIAFADPTRQRIVVAEAFVYAPGKPKRNLMKQVEAALRTIRQTTEHTEKKQQKRYEQSNSRGYHV